MVANNTDELYAIAMYARGLSAAARYSLSDAEGDVTNVREYANGLDSAALQVKSETANEYELDAPGTLYGSLRERYERMAARQESPWFERTAWRDALDILTAPHGAPILFGSSPHYADIYGQGWHYGEYQGDPCDCDECLQGEEDASAERQRLMEAANAYDVAYQASGNESDARYADELRTQAAKVEYETPDDHLYPACHLCNAPIAGYGYTCLDGGMDFCQACTVILGAPSLMDDIIERAANG